VKAYLLKRLLLMLPTLLGITFLTYAIVRLAPGDPIEAMIFSQTGDINPKVMKENADRIRQRLGLIEYHYLRDAVDREYGAPEEQGTGARVLRAGAVAVDKVYGIFLGYGRWMGHLFQGDFGESIKYRTSAGSRNPLDLIVERIPVTFTLNVIAEAVIFLIAIPAGLAAARHQGKWFDWGSSLVLLGLWSIPVILAGTVLLGFLGVGGLGWQVFPVAGLHTPGYETFSLGRYVTDLLWHAGLPVACLVYGGLAYLAKLGRASLLENLRADYVRTARAKGLPEGRVVYHHALRNSLLPMITTMVLILPGLIGGSVIVETLFSIQGTGLLYIGAARAYDLSILMTETLLYGFLTLFFLVVGDMLYAWADPRIRYE
jgi:peptide/nickel transport system permease protein